MKISVHRTHEFALQCRLSGFVNGRCGSSPPVRNFRNTFASVNNGCAMQKVILIFESWLRP
jgi:hypothetical protein